MDRPPFRADIRAAGQVFFIFGSVSTIFLPTRTPALA
jgi:hypothetical protein